MIILIHNSYYILYEIASIGITRNRFTNHNRSLIGPFLKECLPFLTRIITLKRYEYANIILYCNIFLHIVDNPQKITLRLFSTNHWQVNWQRHPRFAKKSISINYQSKSSFGTVNLIR